MGPYEVDDYLFFGEDEEREGEDGVPISGMAEKKGREGRGTGRREGFLHMFQLEHYARAATTDERGVACFLFWPPAGPRGPLPLRKAGPGQDIKLPSDTLLGHIPHDCPLVSTQRRCRETGGVTVFAPPMSQVSVCLMCVALTCPRTPGS